MAKYRFVEHVLLWYKMIKPDILHIPTYKGECDVKHRKKINKSVWQMIPEHIQCLGHPRHVRSRTGIKSSIGSVTVVSADIIVTYKDGDQLPPVLVLRVGQKLDQAFGLLYQRHTGSSWTVYTCFMCRHFLALPCQIEV